ncbi:ABC transporter permease [Rubrimonas cliftonensis]|uniref:Putative spermidine/putrescine transport system permease protein n=1 Tax=Rubrimonas cliftonensis TaxID=89524 RepID=A0A1H4AH61_9RHOB|nr:ABC transporter permease subunit [Rubrimonas cliftonensis]SEA35226.1 putative spermidine/putrescine transport system permease protein [Rubrimonas cliftonensis]
MSVAAAEAPPAAAALPAPRWGRLALTGLVALLCAAPFLLVLVISFGEKVEGGSWTWGLTLANYERFFLGHDWPNALSLVYPQRLWFSVWYAALGAAFALALAFPCAWAITRRSRRTQAAWLAFILASLSLSEVFVVMGWDVLLSRNSGLPAWLKALGVTDMLKDGGWFPLLIEWDLANPRDLKFKTSGFATLLAMTYIVFPYAVILLYPPLSRLDPSLAEAARTMGARPWKVMRTVVLPAVRLPLIGSALLLFVYLLGAYVAVTVFTPPEKQTLTVTIYDAVRGQTLDAPFGAAQSVVLLATAGLCLWAAARAGVRR